MKEVTLYPNEDNIFKFAEKVANSNLLPKHLFRKPTDVAITLLYGKELNIPPMTALQSIYVVHGKPSVDSKTMLALLKRNLKNFEHPIRWEKEDTPDEVVICKMKSDGRSAEEKSFSKKEAIAMGLLSKSQYKTMYKLMMEYRVIARTARFFAPDVINNIYLKDEIEDIEEEPKNNIDLLSEVQDKKNSFGSPNEIKSASTEKDIDDAEIVSDINNPSQIILSIKNRDYTIPIGKYKNKKLYEIHFGELEQLYVNICESLDQGKVGEKILETTKIMTENIKYFLEEYSKNLNKFKGETHA